MKCYVVIRDHKHVFGKRWAVAVFLDPDEAQSYIDTLDNETKDDWHYWFEEAEYCHTAKTNVFSQPKWPGQDTQIVA